MEKIIKVGQRNTAKCFSKNLNFYIDLKCLYQTMRKLLVTKNKLKIVLQDHIYQLGYQTIDDISMKAIQVCF